MAKEGVTERMEQIERVLSRGPMHLKQLTEHLGDEEHRVRYALNNLVFQGKCHIGSWTEHTASDGKARITPLYHWGPGIPVQPPRGRRQVSEIAAQTFNRHADLAHVMRTWANTGEHDAEEQ